MRAINVRTAMHVSVQNQSYRTDICLALLAPLVRLGSRAQASALVSWITEQQLAHAQGEGGGRIIADDVLGKNRCVCMLASSPVEQKQLVTLTDGRWRVEVVGECKLAGPQTHGCGSKNSKTISRLPGSRNKVRVVGIDHQFLKE